DVVLKEKKKIDIRLRVYGAASITTDCEQPEEWRRVPVSPKIFNDVVDFRADGPLYRRRRICKKTVLKAVQEFLQVCSCRDHGSPTGHLNRLATEVASAG